jgi:hypothetical protein
MRSPSATLRRALREDDLPPGTDVSALGVAELPGEYAGRKVTYFRLFQPAQAAARAVQVNTRHVYDDLSDNLDLVLRAGFIERDGSVVVFSDPAAVQTASRHPTERAAHADFERYIGADRAAVS